MPRPVRGFFYLRFRGVIVRYWPIGDAHYQEITVVREAASDPKRSFAAKLSAQGKLTGVVWSSFTVAFWPGVNASESSVSISGISGSGMLSFRPWQVKATV
jgi:hypothetical protein